MERFDRQPGSSGSRWGRAVPAMALWMALVTPVGAVDVCVIVNGLGGLPEYEENFVQWSDRLEKLCAGPLGGTALRLDGRTAGRAEIMAGLRQAASGDSGGDPLWLFLIGHANHDGERFKMHIKGPDLTDEDLLQFLESQNRRKVYVVAATSASGALLKELSGENRVVVTATRNRLERQPPLFLSFFLEAAESAEADTDKNGRVSLLEAFLFSQAKVASWFAEKGRIQTEHPVLDDRGRVRIGAEQDATDAPVTGEGMLSASASLSAPSEKAYATLEAKQLAKRRQDIERDIEDLKFRKGEMPTEQYYEQLQSLLVKLATVNEELERLEAAN